VIATDSFYMRMTTREKLMLDQIARHYQRTKADTLKVFIRETHQLIKQAEKQEIHPTQK
jgi:hypothetical protein